MGTKFYTIMECINSVYAELKAKDNRLTYDTAEEIISNDSKSVEFIKTILQDDEFQTSVTNSELYQVAKVRAQHSVVTFLIGLFFLDHGGFDEKLLDNMANSHGLAMRIWMITALYHDYGYFVKDIKNGKISLKKGITYYLLDDSEIDGLSALSQYSEYHKEAIAYTYEEIEAYDAYARKLHIDNGDPNEKIDHGILGGVRIFHRLVSRALQQSNIKEDELLIIKASCLAIAQHNIFKSNSAEKDKAYGECLKKLYSTSQFVICDDTPLLLLLSLVDTFECVKKLSRGENKNSFFEPKTVLSSIRISVSSGEVVADYSELEKRLDDKDGIVSDNYRAYRDGLLKIGTWTSFEAEEVGTEKIRIKIRKARTLGPKSVATRIMN